MTTHKLCDYLCVAFMVAAIAIVILFMNGEKFGVTKIIDEDSELYEANQYYTSNDINGDWDYSDATKIELQNDTAVIDGSGAYFYDDTLTIVQAGNYDISGVLDGKISIDTSDKAKVWIRLNNVAITCEDDACLRIEQADKVFLTLASGTTNTFSSGASYSDDSLEDGTSGVIFSHDDLTINGSGSLVVSGEYKHGITVKDSLVIAGGNIEINCPEDGIHTNDKTVITGASLTINAEDDGIHSTDEFIMVDGNLLIEGCYEGIESDEITVIDGDITIYSEDDGFNATDGSSTDFGMMRFNGTDDFADEGTDEDEDDTIPFVLIEGGNITIINENANDADGIDSNGDITINGGYIYVSLSGNGSNNALDYGSENGGQLLINGGTVIAAGSSAMAEECSDASLQVSIMYTGSADAGTNVIVSDTSGNVLINQVVQCSFTSIILSCEEFEIGQTYTITMNDVVEEIEIDEVSTLAGEYENTKMPGGSRMNFGGSKMGNNNNDNFGQRPDMSQAPGGPGPMENDGQMPEMNQAQGEDVEAEEKEQAGDEGATSDEEIQTQENSQQTGPSGEMKSNEEKMQSQPGQSDQSGMNFEEGTAESLIVSDSSESVLGYDAGTWAVFGVCVIALLLGILVAMKFKRR